MNVFFHFLYFYERKLTMENTLYQIYDKIFKKILTLSSTAVVNLINGLFDTAYPTDSSISYNWTEFEDKELRRILADTILTIKFLETSVEELNRRKMIILIPFELLKLRKAIEKSRTPENLEALKNMIQNDIIGSINKNLRVENITLDDARKLKRLTHKLYEHIYSNYKEMEALNDMTDESLMLDIDIIEKCHERELAEKDKLIADKDAEIAFYKEQLAKLQAGQNN